MHRIYSDCGFSEAVGFDKLSQRQAQPTTGSANDRETRPELVETDLRAFLKKYHPDYDWRFKS
jgi:hypothetical protein